MHGTLFEWPTRKGNGAVVLHTKDSRSAETVAWVKPNSASILELCELIVSSLPPPEGPNAMASPVIQPRLNPPKPADLKPGRSTVDAKRRGRQFSLRSFKRQVKSSPWQLVHLLHRLTIFGCAFYYAVTSIRAAVAMAQVLSGVQEFQLPLTTYSLTHIVPTMGTSSVRSSPLVQSTLAGDTSPRSDTIYLEANGTSFDACHTPKFNKDHYGNAYLRLVYGHIVEGTKHEFTDLNSLELIRPLLTVRSRSCRAGNARERWSSCCCATRQTLKTCIWPRCACPSRTTRSRHGTRRARA